MMQTTIDARRSLLLVVDVQARLAPAIDEGAAAVENNRRLLQAAPRLQVPVLVTEHYPQGLGATVEPLQAPMAAAGPRGASLSSLSRRSRRSRRRRSDW